MKVLKIVKKTRIDAPIKVFDIEVGDARHYILENGVVSHNSYVPTQVMSGGGGLRFASDDIIMLSKSKDKVGNVVVGGIIKAKTYKSRNSKENQEVSVRLSYETGLDKYFGLLEIAERGGVIKKNGTRYELPDGRKVFGAEINRNPQTVFTDELMGSVNEAAGKIFKYGTGFGVDEPRVVDGALVDGNGEVVDD